jgi:hypothetical protein
MPRTLNPMPAHQTSRLRHPLRISARFSPSSGNRCVPHRRGFCACALSPLCCLHSNRKAREGRETLQAPAKELRTTDNTVLTIDRGTEKAKSGVSTLQSAEKRGAPCTPSPVVRHADPYSSTQRPSLPFPPALQAPYSTLHVAVPTMLSKGCKFYSRLVSDRAIPYGIRGDHIAHNKCSPLRNVSVPSALFQAH